MNNIEAIKVLEEILKGYALTSAQNTALDIAIKTIKLRVPKSPIHVKAYCGTCGKDVIPGRKVCENCGQWILWRDIEE